MIPRFPEPLRKNDALFLYGALHPLPFVYAYCQETTEVVHGPACIAAEEIDLPLCAAHGIPVVRRRGGGGTVILSPGMVVLIVVLSRESDLPATFFYRRIHQGLITLLDKNGITNLKQRGISDICIGNKKILGSSLYLCREPALACYQSVLMVSSDTALIDRYLEHPPREPDYREHRLHEEFCTTLSQEGYACTAEEMCQLINTTLANFL